MHRDAAVIIKLLGNEADSVPFHGDLRRQWLSTSKLACTEVRSFLLAKEQGCPTCKNHLETAWGVFPDHQRSGEIPLHPYDGIAIRTTHSVSARRRSHLPLRTIDTVHVAACDRFPHSSLCAAERRMHETATTQIIPVFPPTSPCDV